MQRKLHGGDDDLHNHDFSRGRAGLWRTRMHRTEPLFWLDANHAVLVLGAQARGRVPRPNAARGARVCTGRCGEESDALSTRDYEELVVIVVCIVNGVFRHFP